MDIADLRLALISLVLKPAYRHLSPADFEAASELAKRTARAHNPQDHFECQSQFWDGIFSKAQRPILREVFQQLSVSYQTYYMYYNFVAYNLVDKGLKLHQPYMYTKIQFGCDTASQQRIRFRLLEESCALGVSAGQPGQK